MQISRQLLLACAVATCLTPTCLRAYDNEAQIRARQALEDKMKQLDVQAPQTTSSPPAVVKKPAPAPKPKKTPAPKPTPPPAPPVVKSAPSAPTYENPPAQPAPAFAPEISQPATPLPASPANDKLHEALHEKMTEPSVSPAVPAPALAPTPAAPVATMPAAPEPPAAPVAPAPPAAPVAPAAPSMAPMTHSTPDSVYSSTPTTAPAESSDNQKLREALNERIKENEASQPPVEASQPTKTKKTEVARQAPPVVSLPPLSGPPSSLPAAKQQKLDALLQQYRADQLTPEQYHEQRAKILSEP